MTLNPGVTDDQMGHYYRKTVAIAGRLGKSLQFEKVMEELQRIHDGAVRSKHLHHIGDITVPERTECFNPDDFFQIRTGLWVSDYFSERVLPAAEPALSLPATTLAAYDLIQSENNEKIRAELPDDHVFEATEGCAVLAGLLERQKNGEEGDLLVNSYANILYVRGITSGVFVVYAHWSAVHRLWYVNASRIDDFRWLADHRVLSRNCLPAEASAQAG